MGGCGGDLVTGCAVVHRVCGFVYDLFTLSF